MGRGAADRLDRPRRQVREVLGDAPGAGRRPVVEPRHLVERGPLVVDVVGAGQVRAGLEHDDADALLAELVGDVPPPAPEPIDDDEVLVVVVERLRGDRGVERLRGRAVGGGHQEPCSIRGRGQPVEVVEAARHVAALVVGRPLVAEQRPDLAVVVERGDHARPHALEELGGADPAQQLELLRVVELGERRRRRRRRGRAGPASSWVRKRTSSAAAPRIASAQRS